jgi:CheY-like chemotaxis protein
LGLAISREISRLLGGEIRLVSSPGQGSTFSLYIPQNYVPQKSARRPAVAFTENGAAKFAFALDTSPLVLEVPRLVNEVGDDRDAIQPGDSILLIVENDLMFAKLLLETAREKGWKGLVTSLGAAALAMTRDYKPHAITLDIVLPDIDGWRVLDRLKNDIALRHIPVCVLSTEDVHDRALGCGAIRVLTKPLQSKEMLEQLLETVHDFIGRRVKDLVVVSENTAQREQLVEFIGGEEFRVTPASNGKDALKVLERKRVDCLVLDRAPSDMTTEDFLERIDRNQALSSFPVILYHDQPLPREDAHTSKARAARSVIFRQVGSLERLLDQTALVLHSEVDKLPEPKRRSLEQLHQTDQVLAGKKVLIVDDDIRNIFALTSILEWRNMMIVSAETGRDAIRILQAQPEVDIVLMDIMMPEMDGLDTTRAIRKLPQFNALPIIAVTAKAMKGDREKCIEAGAWDYLSKPVDTEQLLSVLRVWLHR